MAAVCASHRGRLTEMGESSSEYGVVEVSRTSVVQKHSGWDARPPEKETAGGRLRSKRQREIIISSCSPATSVHFPGITRRKNKPTPARRRRERGEAEGRIPFARPAFHEPL